MCEDPEFANIQNPPTIFIISGGVGTSAEQILYSVLAQFPENPVCIQMVGNIREGQEISLALARAKQAGGLVVHTLVNVALRKQLVAEAEALGVPTMDLMGPLIDWLTVRLGQKPLQQPGKYRQLHRDYFERVAAIEFTLAHDDGKSPEGWPQAEIMLVGVSRAGKTPLSLYLAVLGWKVANYPLVPGIAIPDALFELDPRRVVGLMVDSEQLLVYRQQRQIRLGLSQTSDYMDPETVQEELLQAKRIFRRGSFHMLNMTDRTIEQGADEIIRRLPGRGEAG